MRSVLGYLVAFMWGAVLLGGAFRPQGPDPGAAPRPDVGYPAPPLQAQDLQGNPVSLDDLRGKGVFLNFWASWCGPCRMEMPEIQRLADELPPDTAILTVNMTSQESSMEAAQLYLREHGYTFPVAYDPTGRVGSDYRVISLPTSVFVSRDGIVVTRINGPLSHRAMADYLKAAGR